MKNKREWGRVLKFTLFSISAGAIEMASFALLNELLHGSYWPCYLIALNVPVPEHTITSLLFDICL